MKTQTNQKQNSFIIVAILSLLFLTSCASRDDIVYFESATNNQVLTQLNSYTPIIAPDDLLEISVAALDMQAAGPFNAVGISGNVSPSAKKAYLIDQQGSIDFPVIGSIKLGGLTRLEATELLKEKITVYINNPIVNIKIVNFKVTVLGEVNNPGTFQIENERITILEALGLAGDMTIFGERKNVLVISEEDGKRKYTRVDLTTGEVFKSPVYYLSQNDVIYIEPNTNRINQSKSNFGSIVLPITALLISAMTVVAIYATR